MKYFLICIAILLILLLGWSSYNLWEQNGNYKASVEKKDIAILNRDVEIKVIGDSIKQTLVLLDIHKKLTESAKQESKIYRQRYEGLRQLTKSKNPDTLRVVLGVCDSTVLNQDTLINRLEYEAVIQNKLYAQTKMQNDTLTKQVNDLKFVNTKANNEIQRLNLKAKKGKFWRTVKDVGLLIAGWVIRNNG